MAVTDHAFSLSAQGGNYLKKGEWLGAVSYRWLHADSLFVGTDELPLIDPLEYREFHFIEPGAEAETQSRSARQWPSLGIGNGLFPTGARAFTTARTSLTS